ncbi:hypothetical protein ACTAQI_00430 [Pseudarthrobacter sp. alpha12b]
MTPATRSNEHDNPCARPRVVTSVVKQPDEALSVQLKSAVISYAVQWLAYWLVAAGALFIGSGVGVTITGAITGQPYVFRGFTLETYRIFALQPDHAFASLAVLVVVVFTLSAGFRDSGVTIQPDVSYVRYRVQAWLLALTGVCCNAIVLMLFFYTALNWGSTNEKFQSALLPLALATALAASILSVGRERQMELEAMMLYRGILKLEKQHTRACQKWDRFWAISPAAEGRGVHYRPFLTLCLILTAAQSAVVLIAILMGVGNLFSLMLAPIEIAVFCFIPVFAVMTIVANIIRRIDVMERFFNALSGLVYLVAVAFVVIVIIEKVAPEVWAPHLIIPVCAGLALVFPLLMPLFRKGFHGTKDWKNYAWLVVSDLQRGRELKAEQLRRKRAEAQVDALRRALTRRSQLEEQPTLHV